MYRVTSINNRPKEWIECLRLRIVKKLFIESKIASRAES